MPDVYLAFFYREDDVLTSGEVRTWPTSNDSNREFYGAMTWSKFIGTEFADKPSNLDFEWSGDAQNVDYIETLSFRASTREVIQVTVKAPYIALTHRNVSGTSGAHLQTRLYIWGVNA